jgi:16S rRNA (cytosine967-C5)-methyltransferase
VLPTLNELNGQNPRQIAARVLSQRLNSHEFTENLLEIALATARLSPVDRGLCHELVCGVVRWQATLDQLIARKADPGRAQRPALINLLRLGLYQIFWLDRIPPHAAVHETVELAKRSGYAAQAGFINAVLRGYLREAEGIKKILQDMKTSQPALGWSHPGWLVEKWQKQFGEASTRQLLEWNNTPPKTFARINRLKFQKDVVWETPVNAVQFKDAGDLLTRWREENVEYDFMPLHLQAAFQADSISDQSSHSVPAQLSPPVDFENLVFELKSHPPLNSLGSFRAGWFYVQDPSTLLAPALLDPQPDETVLDLCAAPGGKTTFMAQLMNNTGKIIASDIADDRLKLIRENCLRLGVTGVELRRDYLDAPLTHAALANGQQLFDKILVDAPCSNTGVMRRRVDLRWRIQPEEIGRLQKTQLHLLSAVAGRLKPGGALVYSTCSLEPEENTEVVKQFLAEHPQFRLETERQLLPFADQVDGAYVAKLVMQKSSA